MNRDRWRQIEEVFHRVLVTRDEGRAHLLEESCAGDADLRREVSSLLASVSDAGASIQEVVAAEAGSFRADVHAAAVGRRLGPYRLRALLGEGGMGAVYLAERDDAQFAKQVAIKILPQAIGAPQAVARFRDERQILAALEHRNIVRLLDGGSTDDGLPYLVMEHIEGQPITAFAREHALPIRARVQLVRDVCAALQYAHQNLIIHRDVKPGNILVDEDGTPKLVDFGIAKLLAPASSFEREARTRTGHALFTPEYASPEQVRGEPVSTTTDVYSVGAVLYELVTDQPPHRTTGDVLESIRIICDVDPVRPSLAAPPERRRELAGDLDNIILKALHKDPDRRYRSIEQLSDDLGRFLDGLPVNARVATLGYRARKFAGRNKAAVLATTLVTAALVAGTAFSLEQAARADAQARIAEDAAARALAEKRRAEAEAERAQTAERQAQKRLEQLEEEKARREESEKLALSQYEGRVDAENLSAETKREVNLVLARLAGALGRSAEARRIAEQESRKARAAETRAETTARTARDQAGLRESAEGRARALQEQLEVEAARRKEAEDRAARKDKQVELLQVALVKARKEKQNTGQQLRDAHAENQAMSRMLSLRQMNIFRGVPSHEP